ncbi:thioredoxin family protein [Aquimarina sp. AU474]|uniref:thioredoxin family protein n=1 Tax=Aquimarina sp. AU474 TaxID=2108529 RepID=UPI000D69AFD8|nr:thioredoxin family protein [Aquimarina sp. AU474]
MKIIISLIIVSIISTITLYAQSFNHEIKLEQNSPMLVGKINKEGFNEKPYNDWFSKNHSQYTPKQISIDSLKRRLDQYTIKVFMGTWCGDSKREVPRFYKILENSEYPLDRLTIIGVDRRKSTYKQSPGGEHEGLNIHRVPTFIFYKDGKEVNRIVESPKNTLETDMLNILSGNYTPKYESVAMMHTLLTQKGRLYVLENAKELVTKFRSKTKNLYELNTLANVLFYANKKEEAMAVLEFNTLLFSREANVYISIANKYVDIKDLKTAIKYYQKSLEITDNQEVLNKIKNLMAITNKG